ncbi:MAG: hypothetical protein ACI4QG_00135 [Candidatus Cryptobacteroides sp.]
MRGKRTKYPLAQLCAAIATGLVISAISACSREDAGNCIPDTDASRVEMTLFPQGQFTRAHFEDNDGSASFVWDVGSEMIAVVSNGVSLVRWDGGEWFSGMHISLIDPSDPSKALRAASACTLPSNAAQTGDKLFFVSPVEGSSLAQTASSETAVEVTFSMPATFDQSASGRMEEFEPYCIIRGESTVKSTPTPSDKNFAAASTDFYSIPAIFRFNVTNKSDNDVTLESVKITCNKLFPDKIVWKTDGQSVSVGESSDKSGYFNTIKTSVNHDKGNLIPAKSGETASKGTYYAMCLPFDSDAPMSGATLAFIIETALKTHTFNIPAEDFFRSSAVKTFEGNKIYTFNFNLIDEQSVELEAVTIEDWITDGFNHQIEDVTGNVLVNVSYWVQDRQNLYTYAFLKMVEDSAGYTMWSKCNIGEYIPSSTDNYFRWAEVTPSDASAEDYLAKYYDNITDFKWKTPTRSDYTDLFNETLHDIEMCRDVESGVYGLWIRRKDDAEVELFLPCWGKVNEHTEWPSDGVTETTRTYHGRYWTRDEKDGTSAYFVHFAFQQVERTEGEDASTVGPFTRVLNSGNDIYEFTDTLKRSAFPVKSILKNE